MMFRYIVGFTCSQACMAPIQERPVFSGKNLKQPSASIHPSGQEAKEREGERNVKVRKASSILTGFDKRDGSTELYSLCRPLCTPNVFNDT